MKNSVLSQIADLETLSYAELKERWKTLFGTAPPTYNRRHLIRRLCYRVQELTYGGLSQATRVKLKEHLGGERLDTEAAEVQRLERRSRKDGMPVAGTRLVREWHGERHHVTVLPDGAFEYAGARYRSLSAIAKAITGVHWNGPLFFGLRKQVKVSDGARA